MKGFISKIGEYTTTIYRCARSGKISALENSLIEYYTLGKKSPTLAQIIYKDSFEKQKDLYHNMMLGKHESFRQEHERLLDLVNLNVEEAEKNKTVEEVMKDFLVAEKECYEHSVEIRNKLVKDGRISLDYKKGKANFYYKLKIWFFKKKHKIHNFFKA